MMPYLVDVIEIGGHGGVYSIDFSGTENGATLKKIQVYAGDSWIRGIKVWLTDGRYEMSGTADGSISEFTFEDGELFSALSLWGNGDGTHLGAIKFRTNCSREFFAHMTDWGPTSIQECSIDVGSGICIGLTGSTSSDIDSLGFLFIKTIKSAVLKDVQYPTDVNVNTEEIKFMTYHNNSSEPQEYKIETSKKIIKKSSWSVTNKIEFIYNLEVKAGIPEVVDETTGSKFTVGTESPYNLENTEEKTEKLSVTVKVPPRKKMDVKITIGRVTVDLPYTGKVQITCYNDSVLEFETKGTYKGLTYTDAKVVVSESKVE